VTDTNDQLAHDPAAGRALAKQRALNALTFLLAVAVCCEGYLLWEMSGRVDDAMMKLGQLERNGTAADWKVIPTPDGDTQAGRNLQSQPLDSLLDPFAQTDPLYWDPLADLDRARHEMDLFMLQMRPDSILYLPRVEGIIRKTSPSQSLRVEDAGDSYVATVNLPGVDESDVSVTVSEMTLIILVKQERGTAKIPGGQSSRHERVSGQSVWRMQLTDAVDETGIKSCLKDGLLTITIPKLSRSANIR